MSMNCHGLIKINADVTFFPLVRVCLLVLRLSTWSPLPTVCGRVRGKKGDFQWENGFQWLQKCAVLTEDHSEASAWIVDQHCKSPPKEVVVLYFWLAVEDITYNRWQGGQSHRYQGLWLDWKRNCINTSVFFIPAVKYTHPPVVPLRMVTLGHVYLWHQPQHMSWEEYRNRASTQETFLPLILSLQPLTTPSSGHCPFRQ